MSKVVMEIIITADAEITHADGTKESE